MPKVSQTKTKSTTSFIRKKLKSNRFHEEIINKQQV